MIYTETFSSPLGDLTIASDGEAIVGLWMEGQAYWGSTLPENTAEGVGLSVIQKAKRWLENYFAGSHEPSDSIPLRPEGTDFQRRVWALLREIPYGTTVSYGWLSEKLTGNPNAARAVGSAVGHNPIGILIPCHRVTGAGGKLTGYAGGLERKKLLLDLESA